MAEKNEETEQQTKEPEMDTHKKGSSKPPKKHSVGRIVSNVLIIVGIVLHLVAGGLWWHNQQQYQKQDEENAKLASYVKLSSSDDQPPEVVWAGLKAVNPEIVGWIQIPGTIVNYPVYQGKDNDYYLSHNADGTIGLGGQVFMDFESKAPGMVDGQTLIYGHHLRNGSMFKPVADMDNQQTFDATKTIWYLTEQNTYKLQPLMLYYTQPDDTTVRHFSFKDDNDLRQYLNDKLSKAKTSNPNASQLISTATHVLTLSTCNYYKGYGRTELVCISKQD